MTIVAIVFIVFMASELWSFVYEYDGIGFYLRQPYLILVCALVGVVVAWCAHVVIRCRKSGKAARDKGVVG